MVETKQLPTEGIKLKNLRLRTECLAVELSQVQVDVSAFNTGAGFQFSS